MKIIETTFERLPRERLVIGFEGENLRATVRIDCASVFAEYPNATPTLIVKPLFADAYPVVVDRNGTDVDWLITSEILSFNGDGEIQLVFYKDQVICKSAVSKIRVCRSLQVTGEMPDVVATWIENANRKLAEVDAQIVELEGMVDTATDAATRAEQSASTASIKAEQAAGSAATATAKATEATNAAGTATAKAAEAALSATQASNSAVSAADSERGATAKAGEATTAAGTATAKAEQATEAAQTATEKAGDALASARAAQASATDAASSATAASASETAAKASETAASASATQAAQSVQDAGANAQTAMQKAAEAQQSASNAAASATNAATSAETASTKAGEAAASAQAASDAKTAVEQTAEQLADSLEQIEQNTQDIADLDERKANVDGYYPDMTVGNAEQLNSSKFVENSEPYTLRTSGGTSDIGNREYLDAVVGGTLAWNQMVRDEASENSTDFAPIVTVTDAVEDAAGVKVKIEPLQDLHGYDHPWPAGGNANKFQTTAETKTENGVTWTVNTDGSITVSGTATGYTILYAGKADVSGMTGNVTVGFNFTETTNIAWASSYLLDDDDNQLYTITSGNGNTPSFTVDLTDYPTAKWLTVTFKRNNNVATSGTIKVQVVSGSSMLTWVPYSNICPITGWDGVKVTRTGKNLFDETAEASLIDVFGIDGNRLKRVGYEIHLPTGTYTWSAASREGLGAFLYLNIVNADGSLNEFWYFVASKTVKNKTFTITDGQYVVLYDAQVDQEGAQTKFSNFNIQLELSSTVTDYEPYAGNTYSITLPTEAGTVYGGELTVNADGSGVLTVTHCLIEITQSNIYSCGVDGNNLRVTLTGGIDLRSLPAYQSGLCNKSIVRTTWTHVSNNDNSIAVNTPSANQIIVNRAIAETKDEMIEFIGDGLQIYYPLATSQTFQLTASQIRTLFGQNNVWADTGDLALTYTGTDEHLVLESGKKYLSRISGTDSMLLGSGQEITAAKGTDNVFDLTQMFGTAVADYVYGQGAGFFRKWFGKRWYPYNAGELLSVEGLQSHDMVGFNQWDEEWESGGYQNTTGEKVPNNSCIRSKNFIPVVPLQTYYFEFNSTSAVVIGYDADKNFAQLVTAKTASGAFTLANSKVCYITFYLVGTTYNHDICISLSHNGSRNGEYEPYEKHSYPLDSTVILRGIPKVGSNGVYWDGDRYLPDGTVERRYGVVDLGTLTWGDNGNKCWVTNTIPDIKPVTDSSYINRQQGVICTKYSADTQFAISGTAMTDKTWLRTATVFAVKDTAYENAAAFKAAMSGVLLVYELATPTTETAQPYHSTQWVSDWGTEEFVSTGIVPVGTETRYPANLRDKLQHLPDAASGNGSYLITQTDGQMVLTPFPAPPSSAGNYVLKATVTNGVATYTWEVAT